MEFHTDFYYEIFRHISIKNLYNMRLTNKQICYSIDKYLSELVIPIHQNKHNVDRYNKPPFFIKRAFFRYGSIREDFIPFFQSNDLYDKNKELVYELNLNSIVRDQIPQLLSFSNLKNLAINISQWDIIKHVNLELYELIIYESKFCDKFTDRIDRSLNLPISLKKLSIQGLFNDKLEIIHLSNLKELKLGNSFNQCIDLPYYIDEFYVGDDFDQPICLRQLQVASFGNTFNQPVVIPNTMKMLVFGKKFNQSVDLPYGLTHFMASDKYMFTPELPGTIVWVEPFRLRGPNLSNLVNIKGMDLFKKEFNIINDLHDNVVNLPENISSDNTDTHETFSCHGFKDSRGIPLDEMDIRMYKKLWEKIDNYEFDNTDHNFYPDDELIYY